MAYTTVAGPSRNTISCSHALRFIGSMNGPSSPIPLPSRHSKPTPRRMRCQLRELPVLLCATQLRIPVALVHRLPYLHRVKKLPACRPVGCLPHGDGAASRRSPWPLGLAPRSRLGLLHQHIRTFHGNHISIANLPPWREASMTQRSAGHSSCSALLHFRTHYISQTRTVNCP